jgi:3-hydroxyacyl-CoA dehydrogenase/3a,7a,12a-trihydroxy-5b-cholest-24-enoyl-CoA hydratase
MLRFDGKVVVITGAGAGLGRAYALEFARRGAKVLVNDLGGQATGGGSSQSAADRVVDEISRLTGSPHNAVADYHSVVDGDLIIEKAVTTFGRIDVLVNNAGILRDVTMAKMNEVDWSAIYDVHLKGTFKCTHAAWKHMVSQRYGRIITVTSVAGLYGNFGQVNYSAMKSAMVGFTKSLAKEGAKSNVKVNCIAPMATSRLTEKILPDDIKPFTAPEHVAPVVTMLAHESCDDSGEVLEIAAGWISKVRFQRAKGVFLRPPFTAEQVKTNWPKVGDFSDCDYPKEIHETIMICMRNAEQAKL